MSRRRRAFLHGEDLSQYDVNPPITFKTEPNSPGLQEVEDYLMEMFIKPSQVKRSRAEARAARRKMFDESGMSREFNCEHREDIAEFDGRSVPGEWTIVPGADPKRRLLYLHGGAFTLGSAQSHRGIIYNIAVRTGCVVFGANYGLMPERRRMDGVRDCRAAYQWLLKNGPDGRSSAKTMAIAGDSAGGNLSLSVSNWIKKNDVTKPYAVVALSPATDGTMSGPSFRYNLKSDIMLRPLAAPLAKIPPLALRAGMMANSRMHPAKPAISPIFDDLAGLPPTLIQCSSAEILYDDGCRFAEKARRAGSPVKLQIWNNMPHVWQAFDRMLPESFQALDEIASFLYENGAAPKMVKNTPESTMETA